MTTTGKLIEYLDGGKFLCAYVTGGQAKRLRLVNQNGREMNLPLSRVVHCSEKAHSVDLPREELSRQLQETAETRKQLMEKIDLQEIWELISDEPSDTFQPSFLAELSFGQDVDDDIVSAFLRSVFVDRLFFKYKENRVIAHSAEQVKQLRTQRDKEKKIQLLIKNGADFLQSINGGQNKTAPNDETGEECLAIIRDFYLNGTDAEHADIARKILKTAGFNRPHDPFHLLVRAGVWDKNENIPLLRNDLPVVFPLLGIQQAEMLLQQGVDKLFQDPARKDFTDLRPMTIDGATTLDFDDALTVEEQGENFLVGVHISDVAHYVRPEDPLFLEAMQRGTSIYFPEGQIPMLPRHLSQGICSLIQGELRAALSFMILLSADAEVLKVRIYPSVIKVARRLTYDEADSMIRTDKELSILNGLRLKLRNKRLDAGALLLPFPDVNIHIYDGSRVQVSLANTDTPSRTLVSEMMILANTEAARYVADRMAPGLFRAQKPPKKRVVHGLDNDLFLNSKQRKMLSRGELLINAQPHSGLGVTQYTTITSPIRRLLDLVMQHQIHSLIRREEIRFTEEMCKDFTSVIGRTLARANNVRQQRHRYWLLKYLEARQEETHTALVLESGPKRTFLLLTDILLNIDLPTPGRNRPDPGCRVQVKVVRVDALDNTLRFEW
ncbi:MAG: RNB domain-containing ribonuclease [Thermodesulfobacteriota bacterium]|nr:RNB domain-containing ribonuclease [Thermodesulfobacteriota bacterium]